MRAFNFKSLLTSLTLLTLIIGCGGGAGSESSVSSSMSGAAGGSPIAAGGAGLLPIPEDISDLPNTLPGAFANSACPSSATKPILQDLTIRLSASNGSGATQGVFQGTGAIFVNQNSSTPATIALDIRSISNQVYPLAQLSHSIVDYVSGGKVYEANGEAVPTPIQDFGSQLPRHSFLASPGPAYQVIQTSFIPDTMDNHFTLGLPAEGFEGNLSPGAYAFAVKFETATHIICTVSTMLLVIQ